MLNIRTYDAATPFLEINHDGTPYLQHPGLTKYEHFMALALPATIQELSFNEYSFKVILEVLEMDPGTTYDYKIHWPMFVAKRTQLYVDALFAAMNARES